MKEQRKVYTIDAEMIKRLYANTDDCELRQELKEAYPDVFVKPPTIFEFGSKNTIDTMFYGHPLTIGKGIVPFGNEKKFSGKCLILNEAEGWEMKQIKDAGYHFIYFEKK